MKRPVATICMLVSLPGAGFIFGAGFMSGDSERMLKAAVILLAMLWCSYPVWLPHFTDRDEF